MKYAKRISCTALALMALFTTPLASADGQQGKTEADIRWEAATPMVNLYLKHASAHDFVDAGDNEKSRWGNYAGALAYYLAATDRDPHNSWGPYQAAASLSYLKMPTMAKRYVQEADKRGFWQYKMAVNDSEMSLIKDSPEFKQLLAHAKARYALQAKDAGKAFIHVPEGKAPQGGWPVLVWLAGYGTEGSDSADLARNLAAGKVVFIGINGTEKLDDHSFRWSRTETKTTQDAVQNALTQADKQTQINHKNVVLIGFSQGSLHAAHLISEYSDYYTGALLASAGGKQKTISVPAPHNKRIIMTYGEKEYKSNRELDSQLQHYFAPSNQLQVYTHKGGHSFDHDWREKYNNYLDYIFQFHQS